VTDETGCRRESKGEGGFRTKPRPGDMRARLCKNYTVLAVSIESAVLSPTRYLASPDTWPSQNVTESNVLSLMALHDSDQLTGFDSVSCCIGWSGLSGVAVAHLLHGRLLQTVQKVEDSERERDFRPFMP